MNKLRVFISSVQAEFSSERQMLFDYLTNDALLGRFFDAFIFEQLPAADYTTTKAYLEQVKKSDIYLGIFGKEYGYEDKDGYSPTEKEFDLASSEYKIRLIFISHHNNEDRHPKEQQLISKAEHAIVRKKFKEANDLKISVYAALVNLLEEKELIRTGPFDATICKEATMDDIDTEKIQWLVRTAQAKRGFPLSPETPSVEVLTHLNLLKSERLTNAAVLLFGKQPQRFFITSEVRCAMFHGNEISKPIPSYQIYKGNLFQMVDQAVDFVLSRIDLFVGDRSQSVDVPVYYEIPRNALAEAIVNAVAHRDYTSNGSVQVMLFRNRIEIWNPGQLPFHLTIPKLKKPHGSFPANPLIAESLYLAGYIERMGTGIPDMIKACLSAGLKEPELVQDESFKTILWRKVEPIGKDAGEVTGEATGGVTGEATGGATGGATGEVTREVKRVILILKGEMKRSEIQSTLELKHDDYFRINYITPSLQSGCIEMTFPKRPNHPHQKYRLTPKGKELQKRLKKNNNGL